MYEMLEVGRSKPKIDKSKLQENALINGHFKEYKQKVEGIFRMIQSHRSIKAAERREQLKSITIVDKVEQRNLRIAKLRKEELMIDHFLELGFKMSRDKFWVLAVWLLFMIEQIKLKQRVILSFLYI